MDEAIAIGGAIGVVFANLIADLPYAAVNPRIRYKVYEEVLACRHSMISQMARRIDESLARIRIKIRHRCWMRRLYRWSESR